VARERLQILLEYERKLGSQIDLFTALREEILAVVSRHVADPEKVQVTVDRGSKFSRLAVDIEIPNIGGKAPTLPTDCPVPHRDKTVGMRSLPINKGQMMRGVDAAAGTLAVPLWSAGATGGAISARAGGIALITSLFSLIPAVVLGAWLYVQQRDVSEHRTLDDRNTALMISNALHPADGVAAAAGPSVVLQGISGPGTVASLPRDPAAALASQSAVVNPQATLESAPSPREPDSVLQTAIVTGSVTSLPREPSPVAAEPVLQPATVTESVTSLPREPPPVAAEPVLQTATVTESVTSSPPEPPPLRDPTTVDLVLQTAAVTPLATLGSNTSPPNEPPTAPSQEPPPGSVTPLPPRRPLQIRIATPPRAVPLPALLRRREAP
jgi:cell division topological specificity factor